LLNRLLGKDFLSGVLFIAFGLAALWFGRNLAVGTAVRMGPGYVPHMLAYIMLVLGLIIAAVSLYTGGEEIERPKWRPITMVTVGIVVFALLFETTGMFPSLVALVLIASLGGDEFKITEVIANIVVLTILCVIVFKVGLGMNIAVINGVW
jgi:hypothetical protein